MGAAIAAFALLRPGPFRATVTNPNALVRIAALVLALTGLSFLIRRVISNGAARSIIIAVPALVVLGVIVAPYFRNKTVIERLPVSAAELRAGRPSSGPVPLPPANAAPGPAPSPGPSLLSAGRLRGIDHQASGVAAIYRFADGAALVRLEGIDVENGPDYRVYLVPGANRRQPDRGISLGRLKGNKGSQNYPVPRDANPEGVQTVLIWCRAFAVPVANATQQARTPPPS